MVEYRNYRVGEVSNKSGSGCRSVDEIEIKKGVNNFVVPVLCSTQFGRKCDNTLIFVH